MSLPSGTVAIFSTVCRPSQAAHHVMSVLRTLADEANVAGVPWLANRTAGTIRLKHLPATLCAFAPTARRSCRGIAKGLLFPTGLTGLFSCTCEFNGLQVKTAWPSLVHSCRTPIKRLGISLP